MGILSVETVFAGLTAAGLRAAAAYPGEKMPYLAAPAVAVGLEKVENGVYTVRAEVLSPAYLGGAACEEYAESARTAMKGTGAVCVQDAVEYDGRTDLFRIRITGQFLPEEEEETPEEEEALDLTVKLGSVTLGSAVEFTASQETEDPTATALSGCGWSFRIREFFTPGTTETTAPTEPFTMTVKRTGTTEYYSECYFTSVKRTDGEGGLEQVRTGISSGKSFITVA